SLPLFFSFYPRDPESGFYDAIFLSFRDFLKFDHEGSNCSSSFSPFIFLFKSNTCIGKMKNFSFIPFSLTFPDLY
ncbi:hypothetical protein NL449_28510, partial [Klebsiella pneumoniae]|nr:hypothetical protein [Klebsiella pneumoniae]